MAVDYIDPPIVVDPEQLTQLAYDYLQAAYPGWAPADGNLDTRLLQAAGRILSVVASLASGPPSSIFQTLGRSLFAIPPVAAAPATAQTTWTAQDDAGYTIHAGTLVGIRAAGDILVPFTVLEDVIIPSGSTATAAGEVTIVAVTPGAAGSGLGMATGPVELSDTVAYILPDGIVLVDATMGGVDAEPDDVYQTRLVGKLQLLSPAPIIPSDFAVLAEDTAGVERALVIDGYNPFANELETVSMAAAGGTFTLTFSGQTTAAIAWNAAASAVQSALEALSNIAPGDVICTGGPLNTTPVTVEFAATYDGTNVTQMTANSASLTGGSHTATVATVRDGSARTDNERMVAVFPADAAGQPVSTDAKTDLQARLEALREVNFDVNVADPTYTAIKVSFAGVSQPGYDPADVNTRAEAAVAAFLDPSTWGIPSSSEARTWVDQPIVRRFKLVQVVENVTGMDYVTALTLAKQSDSLSTSDVTLVGPAALPTAGTIAGTVTAP